MGYTHYWKRSPELPIDRWRNFASDARRIAAASDVPLRLEYDSEESPEFSDDEVFFNGVGHDGHEPFVIERMQCRHPGFTFCKTALKPYDKVVVACLFAAQARFGELFSWSSDGDARDHADGKALYERAVNREQPNVSR